MHSPWASPGTEAASGGRVIAFNVVAADVLTRWKVWIVTGDHRTAAPCCQPFASAWCLAPRRRASRWCLAPRRPSCAASRVPVVPGTDTTSQLRRRGAWHPDDLSEQGEDLGAEPGQLIAALIKVPSHHPDLDLIHHRIEVCGELLGE